MKNVYPSCAVVEVERGKYRVVPLGEVFSISIQAVEKIKSDHSEQLLAQIPPGVHSKKDHLIVGGRADMPQQRLMDDVGAVVDDLVMESTPGTVTLDRVYVNLACRNYNVQKIMGTDPIAKRPEGKLLSLLAQYAKEKRR